MNPRIHLVALPHVRLGTASTHLCAYSGKVMKFCKMMGDSYDIVLYAPESDMVPGVRDQINCLSNVERIATFGLDDDNRLPNWPTDEQSRSFVLRAMAELHNRGAERELVLLSAGETFRAIEKEFPARAMVEPFVGYEGVLRGRVYAAYESYFHMAQVAQKYAVHDIRWYDRVIPPFIDFDDFPLVNSGNGKYLLFLGRLIARKGAHIALQIAEACKLPLIVAGAGGTVSADGKIVGNGVTLESKKIPLSYLGPVSPKIRNELMAGAIAFVCPTTYAEPGGNVAIEAMASGTPVIAPDWGVFSETVVPWKTGFHFRTLREAVDAVSNAKELLPTAIRAEAHNYSLESTMFRFKRWFEDIMGLWSGGWEAL